MGNRYPKDIATAGKPGKTLAAVFNVGVLKPQDWEDTDKSKGQGPMKIFTAWSGLKLNFAETRDGKSIGGDGQIEMSHIADVLERSRNAARMYQEYTASHKKQSNMPELLNLRVKFLPTSMSASKGQTVSEIAGTYPLEQVEEAARNLDAQAQKGGAYADANAKQAMALRIAAVSKACRELRYDNKPLAEVFMQQDWNQVYMSCAEISKSPCPDNVKAVAKAAYTVFQGYQAYRDVLSYEFDGKSSETYDIYEPVFKTPNNKAVDAEGLTKAYELSISFNPAAEYPVSVKLTTMRAKPSEGTVGITSRDTIKDTVYFKQDLPMWKWMEMIEGFDSRCKALMNVCIAQAYQAMLSFDNQNRS